MAGAVPLSVIGEAPADRHTLLTQAGAIHKELVQPDEWWMKADLDEFFEFPMALQDVVRYLVGVLDNEQAMDRTFEVGGPDVLTYGDMLRRAASRSRRHVVGIGHGRMGVTTE